MDSPAPVNEGRGQRMAAPLPEPPAPAAARAAPPRATFEAVAVTPERRLDAAALLVGRNRADARDAGRRFLEASRKHSIDTGNLWASVISGSPAYHQACLAVPAAGRTAMLFTSTPRDPAEIPALTVAVQAAAAHAAIRADAPHSPSLLAQALLDPAETAVAEALLLSGFRRLADLSYLRLDLATWKRRRAREAIDDAPWPEGVSVANARSGADADLLPALKRSYIDTLDCPELCDLRSPEDVLESHRATGRFDARLWWVIRRDAEPEGAMLFNVCPGQGHTELVYLGIGPGLRGKGLGVRLMRYGLDRVASIAHEPAVTCAVDHRNSPARRLYASLGFEEFARRVAMVKPLQGPAQPKPAPPYPV